MRKQALDRVEFEPLARDPLAESEFAAAMLRALRSQPRTIAPKFFYDQAGASLFERICELDEYYLTRDEIAILREHAQAIAGLIGPHADVVEFGDDRGFHVNAYAGDDVYVRRLGPEAEFTRKLNQVNPIAIGFT